MYKVVYKNTVIDVIEKPTWVRYIKQTGRVTLCDKGSAHGIYSSNKKSVYMLQGRLNPEAENYKTVTLLRITESEFERLKEQLRAGEKVCGYPNELVSVRDSKISELSKCCNDAIVSGVSVLMSDCLYHHFKLTVEDQLNIASLEKQINAGAKTVVYHETDKVSTVYSAKDIAKLLIAVDKHRNYHTLYFNLLKHFINNCVNIGTIDSINYGVDLKELGLAKELLDLIEE